jgi:conjugal transfer pilus assembly protein TraB
MAMNPVAGVKQWWLTATPRQQKLYILLGVALVIALGAFIMSQLAPKTRARPQDKRVETSVMLPQRKDLSAESLQSQMTSLQNQVRDIMAYLRSVDNNVKTANDNINAKIDQKLEDVVSSRTLQEKIERAVEGKVLESNERARGTGAPGGGARPGGESPDAGAPLPSYAPTGPTLPGIGSPGSAVPQDPGATAGAPAAPAESKQDEGAGQMRIGGRAAAAGATGGAIAGPMGAGGRPGGGAGGAGGAGSSTAQFGDPGRVNPATSGGVQLGKPGRAGVGTTGLGTGNLARTDDGGAAPSANQTARDRLDDNIPGESIQLTAGAIFSGVLLNGMDAPTSQTAQKNPTPAIIRVKHEAILPNRWKSSAVKECFVLAGGYGVMSTERANMRTETLTCIMANGRVFEGKLDGYIVGEDGKVGMRGRLVTKQGAAIANAMVAGVLSGIGNAMAQSVAYGTIETTGGFFTSTASAQEVLQNGAYQGIGNALNTVAKFYTDMAKEMFPVVEIDAGRAATIILVKGINLRQRA